MNKLLYLLPIIFILLIYYGVLGGNKEVTFQNISSSPTPFLDQVNSPTPTDITANFEIYTLGTKRTFTDKRYHNLSPDVYITSTNPNIIYVKKIGTTWNDFFATLPMKLENDCLVTGTKQTFCSNDKNILKFYINNLEDQDALDKVIEKGDFLKVVYE